MGYIIDPVVVVYVLSLIGGLAMLINSGIKADSYTMVDHMLRVLWYAGFVVILMVGKYIIFNGVSAAVLAPIGIIVAAFIASASVMKSIQETKSIQLTSQVENKIQDLNFTTKILSRVITELELISDPKIVSTGDIEYGLTIAVDSLNKIYNKQTLNALSDDTSLLLNKARFSLEYLLKHVKHIQDEDEAFITQFISDKMGDVEIESSILGYLSSIMLEAAAKMNVLKKTY